jgi:hypothetical protein
MKADSIGIMDQAFFVGKNIILGWINEFFDVSTSSLLLTFKFNDFAPL